MSIYKNRDPLADDIGSGPVPGSSLNGSLLDGSGDGSRITVLLAAFEGWNDAGEAASDTLKYLAEKFGTQETGSIDPEEYYDFQFTRPRIQRDDNGKQKIVWPLTTVSYARLEGHPLNIALVHGVEPSYKWQSYIEELEEHIQDFEPDYIVMLGSLLADVPYTRPSPITITSENPQLRKRLGIERSECEGAVGIVGILAQTTEDNHIPTVSLWAAVPHYISHAPSSKAKLSLIQRLEELLGVPLCSPKLLEEATRWEREADELADEDPDVASYVAELEQIQDTVDLSDATGEAIAREFEKYLKQRGKK